MTTTQIPSPHQHNRSPNCSPTHLPPPPTSPAAATSRNTTDGADQSNKTKSVPIRTQNRPESHSIESNKAETGEELSPSSSSLPTQLRRPQFAGKERSNRHRPAPVTEQIWRYTIGFQLQRNLRRRRKECSRLTSTGTRAVSLKSKNQNPNQTKPNQSVRIGLV